MNILRNASISWILVIFGTNFFTFILRAWRWSLLLKVSGYTPTITKVFHCTVFGWLLNYLLPARIGDIGRGVALKLTGGVPFSVSLSTIILERIFDMITLVSLLGISVSLFYYEQFLWVYIFAVGIIIILILLIFIPYTLGGFIVKLLGSKITSIEESIHQLKESLNSIRKNKIILAFCVILSLPIWFFEILSLYFAAKAIDFEISFLSAIASGVVAFIFQAVPSTPGGIGVHEVSIVGVLSFFGIPANIGLSIALLDHFARMGVIYTLGLISTVNIGFISSETFKEKIFK